MPSLSRILLGAGVTLGSILPALSASSATNEADFTSANAVAVDVCIVGGGSTGTYSAVRLSQDLGKSVVIVEKAGVLGGHTNTYLDPATNSPVDYGVLGFHNISVVTNHFARFNVSTTQTPLTIPFTTEYIDLKIGQVVPGYTPPDPSAALLLLAQQLLKYPGLQSGYKLPDPIPADLLLSFGDFVAKYGIQDAVPLILNFQAIGDVLHIPTLYIFQNFGLQQLQTLAAGGYIATTRHDNSELYRKAAALLGSSVLYNSTILHAVRHDNGTHQITVQTPTGRKLIKAKKLLMTIPPILDNVKPLGLDGCEHNVFSQWQYTTYYCGIVRNGIPANISITNVAANTPLHIPTTPFISNFGYSGVTNLHTFTTIFDSRKSPAQVEAFVTSSIAAMQKSGVFPASAPAIVALNNHTPTIMRVSADAIKNGFYSKLNALQGQHGTFWTGAAWAPDDSSLLWQFTEGILALVVKALR